MDRMYGMQRAQDVQELQWTGSTVFREKNDCMEQLPGRLSDICNSPVNSCYEHDMRKYGKTG